MDDRTYTVDTILRRKGEVVFRSGPMRLDNDRYAEEEILLDFNGLNTIELVCEINLDLVSSHENKKATSR